ncbi:MAG: hypothetical protein U0821_27125 [Chloroflexota bacterium]
MSVGACHPHTEAGRTDDSTGKAGGRSQARREPGREPGRFAEPSGSLDPAPRIRAAQFFT